VLFAQDATTIIPGNNNTVKDTSRQTDLIDITKELFNISPKKAREEKEKKIYFSVLPVPGSVPGGSGRALITSTTAATYLGPRNTTNLSRTIWYPFAYKHMAEEQLVDHSGRYPFYGISPVYLGLRLQP
jgi:hypothetical protein